jgi:hypothetical protein
MHDFYSEISVISLIGDATITLREWHGGGAGLACPKRVRNSKRVSPEPALHKICVKQGNTGNDRWWGLKTGITSAIPGLILLHYQIKMMPHPD